MVNGKILQLNMASWLFLSIVIFQSSMGFADDSAAEKIKEFASRFVVVLSRPITVYSWSSLASPTQGLNEESLGNQYIRNKIDAYWSSRSTSMGGSFYGAGIYTSVDPVATRSYGKTQNWVLYRIQLPANSRVLRINKEAQEMLLPQNVVEALIQIGCPEEIVFGRSPLRTLDQLMDMTLNNTGRCIQTLKNIFDEELEIDAFAYRYYSSHFEVVQNEGMENRSALVVTSHRRLDTKALRLYTRESRDSREERRRIQSLFYLANKDLFLSPNAIHSNVHMSSYYTNMKGKEIPGFPGLNLLTHISRSAHGGRNYIEKIQLCPPGVSVYSESQGCIEVTDIPQPSRPEYPQTMSSNNHPLFLPSWGRSTTNFPWEDLEQTATIPEPEIREWVEDNFWGYGSTQAFLPLQPKSTVLSCNEVLK